MTTQVDFPQAKRIAVWSGFQRGRNYQHLRFIVIDALAGDDGDFIRKLQDEGHAYHYFITEDGQCFQQVLEENTAVTNAVGERPEQFWYFASQHGQVDILTVHIALVISARVTREMLTTLADLLADLHRRHRLELVPASNNGGVALRSSLDISRDMRGFTPEILKDVLTSAQMSLPTLLEKYPSVTDALKDADKSDASDDDKDDETDEKDDEKDEKDEKPKRGRPRKASESKDDEKGSDD